MNSSKKLLKILSLLILPMILPILFLFLIFCSVDLLFQDQIIYFGYKSLLSASIIILVFQLILDSILSIFGLSPLKREKMSKDKLFTFFIFEGVISFSSIILGYRFMKTFNMTTLILFKSGLLFVAIGFTIFDLVFFLIYTKFNMDKYLGNTTK